MSAFAAPHSRASTISASARSSREGSPNPQSTFLSFLNRLNHASTSNDDPRLSAIALELEALNSIFEASLRAHERSRPGSWHGPKSAVEGEEQMDFTSLKQAMKSIPTNSSSFSDVDPPMSPTTGQGISHLDELNEKAMGPMDRVRYELVIAMFEDGDSEWASVQRRVGREVEMPLLRILVSLPPTYPDSGAPQLQLLGRYIGHFPIDPTIFGEITRTYISSSGPTFIPGDVCVFEGIQYVLSKLRAWYIARMNEGVEAREGRMDSERRGVAGRAMGELTVESQEEKHGYSGPSGLHANVTGTRPPVERHGYSWTGEINPTSSAAQGLQTPPIFSSNIPLSSPNPLDFLPSSVEIFSSDPIVSHKSTFIGHCCAITDPAEVPLVVHRLLSDRKIAKASHPVIHAWRIVRKGEGGKGDVIISDNDDDGETSAGGRLAHLLQILEMDNVLVVVSRWYGGTLLGPERFKLINQAARDALELGGFLDKQLAGDEKMGKKGRH